MAVYEWHLAAYEPFSNVHRGSYNYKSLMLVIIHYMELTVVGDQGYQFPADILWHICRWEMSSDSLNSSLFGWVGCQTSGEGLTADVSDMTASDFKSFQTVCSLLLYRFLSHQN